MEFREEPCEPCAICERDELADAVEEPCLELDDALDEDCRDALDGDATSAAVGE